MESLIPVINELQRVFHKTGMEMINLPQIVVVGSQSCGKSSVLESLVKKSFLPRGSGIVTRCPIILQLHHTKTKEEWCVLSHDLEKKYTDFDEIREAIEERTSSLAGTNKGISVESIVVEVHSPKIINLTVVDLPGIVKVPVGDQPMDIENQVREMILFYIKNPRAIILAVSPANADIATSESIKLASEVDPLKDRTIGVITKLDLMDKGTDANKVLSGEIINMKLGMIGVVNRSQQDINENKSIEDALQCEEDFIKNNYPNHIGRIGSEFLAKRLNVLLMNHIHKSLPDLIIRINNLTDECEETLDKLGPEIVEDTQNKMLIVMESVHDFVNHFKTCIKDRPEVTTDVNRKLFAVDIAKIFEDLEKKLKDDNVFLKELKSKITVALRNSVNIERFSSIEDVFKHLVKKEILLMEAPAVACASNVHRVLYEAVEDSIKEKRFSKLNSLILTVARKVLSTQLKVTREKIKEHLQIETGMIFTSNAEFVNLLKVSHSEDEVEEGIEMDSSMGLSYKVINGVSAAINKNDNLQSASFPLSSTINGQDEDTQCTYVESLITKYFNVIRCEISDFIPKCIMFHMYECTVNGEMKDKIRAATNGKENELVSEPDEDSRKRKETKELHQNLIQAADIISGIQIRG